MATINAAFVAGVNLSQVSYFVVNATGDSLIIHFSNFVKPFVMRGFSSVQAFLTAVVSITGIPDVVVVEVPADTSGVTAYINLAKVTYIQNNFLNTAASIYFSGLTTFYVIGGATRVAEFAQLVTGSDAGFGDGTYGDTPYGGQSDSI
jgi:hypothetical protein